MKKDLRKTLVGMKRHPQKRPKDQTCLLFPPHYRVANTHRMPYLKRPLSAIKPYSWLLFCGKRPIISGSFAGKDLQIKASYASSPL